jgi:hypothetical protein
MTGESERKRVMHLHAIRALLLGAEDGLTAGDLARTIGANTSAVLGILTGEYGFFIDRYDTSKTGMPAVWMCVPVPENCPKPDQKGAAHAAHQPV